MPVSEPTLQATEADVARWAAELAGDPRTLRRLRRDRGWTTATTRAQQFGRDQQGRITIPVRDAAGLLIGVRRYQPFRARGPKMLNVPGSRAALFPAPKRDLPVLLCEGEPDALCALSHGLNATSIPGDQSWQPEWAHQLPQLVVVAMDADTQGRDVAQRMAGDLRAAGRTLHLLDPAPERSDGDDISDLLRDGRLAELGPLLAETGS